jgi:hypothetical protein
MKRQFLNYQLVISLGMCTLFMFFFVAVLDVFHFRQEAFNHANNLKKNRGAMQCTGERDAFTVG